MTGIPMRKLSGLCEILNGPVKLKEEKCMLCCSPWKDSGQLDELYWITVPAQNLFMWFSLWYFFMYVYSKQGLERDFPSPGEELGVFPLFTETY